MTLDIIGIIALHYKNSATYFYDVINFEWV